MKSGKLETERKYLEPDFQELRAALLKVGAETSGPHFESNVVLDTSEHALATGGSLLRLRRQQWPGHEKCLLTFKRKLKRDADEDVSGIKAREEFEMEIPDLAMMRKILACLGYRPVAAYEKIRESWRFSIAGFHCEVDLDTLVFGRVVEIEASPGLIERAARALGLDKYETSAKNYHELNLEWRRANNMPFSADILFGGEEKKRIYHALGLTKL